MKISTPRHLRRRDKLEQLVEKFGASVLAGAIDTPKSHISALLAGKRGIGDQLSLKLDAYAVENWAKKPGWIDAEESTPAQVLFRSLDKFEVMLINLFRDLEDEDERHAAIVELNERRDRARARKAAAAGIPVPPDSGNPWAGARDRRKMPGDHDPERRLPPPIQDRLNTPAPPSRRAK